MKRQQLAEAYCGGSSRADIVDDLGARGNYRGLGGCGFGTPVVSYAPRPMFASVVSLSIMKASKGLGSIVSKCSIEERRDDSRWARIYSAGNDVWRLADSLTNRLGLCSRRNVLVIAAEPAMVTVLSDVMQMQVRFGC